MGFPACRPLGFDFDGAGFAGGVVVEAAPAVVSGRATKPLVTGLRWM
jgi:hypothetical protein